MPTARVRFSPLAAAIAGLCVLLDCVSSLAGGSFGQEMLIASNLYETGVLASVDLDGDDDLDVVIGSNWYENTDGLGTFAAAAPFSGDSYFAEACLDFDFDGDIDIIARSDLYVFLYENDGAAHFAAARYLTNTYTGSFPGSGSFGALAVLDLGADGDMDIVTSNRVLVNLVNPMSILVWENLDAETYEGRNYTVYSGLRSVSAMGVGDLDGDGDPDLVVGGYYPLGVMSRWFRNFDGGLAWDYGSGSTAISSYVDRTAAIRCRDLDNDGDQDIAMASEGMLLNCWFENVDGAGTFTGIHGLGAQPRYGEDFSFGEIDGDGDQDVVMAYQGSDLIGWQANIDGVGGFSGTDTVSVAIRYPTKVDCADINGDGLADVVCYSETWNSLYWFPNHRSISSADDPNGSDGCGPPAWLQTLRVQQVSPNPFNPQTEIEVYLGSRTHLLVAVYDACGRKVAVLCDREMDAGNHPFTFSGAGLASGVYFVRAEAPNHPIAGAKMTLLK